MKSRSKVQKDQLLIKRDQSKQIKTENEAKHINGIYFCQRCNNIIHPFKAKDMILQFVCQTCGIRTVNFAPSSQQQCMLSNKQINVVAKKIMPNPIIVFDQTLPRLNVKCPQCQYPQSAYIVITDQKEDRLITKMYCLSIANNQIKCGNTWQLDPEYLNQNEQDQFESLINQKYRYVQSKVQKNNQQQHKEKSSNNREMMNSSMNHMNQLFQERDNQNQYFKLNINLGSKMMFG